MSTGLYIVYVKKAGSGHMALYQGGLFISPKGNMRNGICYEGPQQQAYKEIKLSLSYAHIVPELSVI